MVLVYQVFYQLSLLMFLSCIFKTMVLLVLPMHTSSQNILCLVSGITRLFWSLTGDLALRHCIWAVWPCPILDFFDSIFIFQTKVNVQMIKSPFNNIHYCYLLLELNLLLQIIDNSIDWLRHKWMTCRSWEKHLRVFRFRKYPRDILWFRNKRGTVGGCTMKYRYTGIPCVPCKIFCECKLVY